MDRIVVGIDGSEGARLALRWAVDEAGPHGATVEPVLAYDFLRQPHAEGRDHFDPEWSEEAAGALLRAEVEAAVGASPAVPVTPAVVVGQPVPALLDRAGDRALLVLGTRGVGGFRGLLLGSVSQACLAHATGPVAVVPTATEPGRKGRVLVGVDGSAASLDALAWATEEARRHRAELEILHARDEVSPLEFWRVPGDDQDRASIAQRLRELVVETVGRLADLDVVLTVVDRRPVQALLEHAAEARSVVVGARGHGGFAALRLGSTSAQLAAHAASPVVVVRATPSGPGADA